MNRKIFLKSRGIALEAKAKQLNPNIRPILLIFDPIEFPNAISGVSLSTDEMLTNISGADVPRAIKVKPIIKSLMPIFLANIEEFDMNLSAPQMRPTSPIERKINDINIDSHIDNMNYIAGKNEQLANFSGDFNGLSSITEDKKLFYRRKLTLYFVQHIHQN